MSIRNLVLSDIPESVVVQVGATVRAYSTILVRNGELGGSGTFVKCGDKYGILTAHHVAFQCSPPFDFDAGSNDRLGLSIAEFAHAFEIEMRYLVPHEIGRPTSDPFGPDLLFLEIARADSKLHEILARRSFWDISLHPEARIAECYRDFDLSCVWVNTGSPYEMRREDTPSHGFSRVWAFPTLASMTGIEATQQSGLFDYFDTSVSYKNREDLPSSFGGVSGGGLWRVPLRAKTPEAPLSELQVGKPTFAGVVFYQGPIQGERRILRAHGPKSVYEMCRRAICG